MLVNNIVRRIGAALSLLALACSVIPAAEAQGGFRHRSGRGGFQFLVAAITPVAGLTPTVFASGQAPNLQYHPNTASVTMRAATTFNGYISGYTLTATTAPTGGAILEGQVITVGAAATTRIVKPLTLDSSNSPGGVGTYAVSISQTVGSSGSPVTFTIPATQITSINDTTNTSSLALTVGSDGEGPRLMTDALGRKFLRFISPHGYTGSWLQNLNVTGFDKFNTTMICVCRVHATIGNMSVATIGSTQLGTGQGSGATQLGTYTGMVSALSNRTDYNNGSAPSNINRLWVGMQLQVFGSSIATDDGVGGSSGNGSEQAMVGVNEQTAIVANNTNGRNTGINGFEVGKAAGASAGNNGSAYAFIDMYELDVFSTGQMGTRAQQSTRYPAAMAKAQANFAIPAITDSLIFLGDSRAANGTGIADSTSTDGAGYTIATIIGEPGSGLPASTRVLNYARTGLGIGALRADFDRTLTSKYNVSTPLMSNMMLGGGHDTIHVQLGINDLGGQWPNDTNGNSGTALQADDMYSASRSGTFLATATDEGDGSAGTLQVGSPSGYVGRWSIATFTNAISGLSLTADFGGGNWLIWQQRQVPAVTSVAATANLYSYKATFEQLLTRGFRVVVAREEANGSSESAGTIELRSKLSGIVADVTADLGGTPAIKTYGLNLITVGGVAVFGSGWNGLALTDVNYVDGTHNTAFGKRVLVSGGDTPQYGILYNVTH